MIPPGLLSFATCTECIIEKYYQRWPTLNAQHSQYLNISKIFQTILLHCTCGIYIKFYRDMFTIKLFYI